MTNTMTIETAYHNYSSELKAYANRRLDNPAAAESIVGEAFMALIGVDGVKNMRSFLFHRVAELATRYNREGKEVDNIDRLQTSKQASDEIDYLIGFAHGRGWAQNKAEAVELERLAASTPDDWTCEDYLLGVLRPDEDIDGELGHFWDGVQGDYPARPEFLRGFAEGAIAAWEEVSALV
jgi:hypothetical protein